MELEERWAVLDARGFLFHEAALHVRLSLWVRPGPGAGDHLGMTFPAIVGLQSRRESTLAAARGGARCAGA